MRSAEAKRTVDAGAAVVAVAVEAVAEVVGEDGELEVPETPELRLHVAPHLVWRFDGISGHRRRAMGG